MFPQVEGLKNTLEQWVVSPTVREVLDEYTKGLRGVDEVKIEPLAETLIKDTQSFLPERDVGTAQGIVSTFLCEARHEYLKTPELGLPFIANRVEEVVRSTAGINVQLAGLEATLPSAAGHTAERAFDLQLDEAKSDPEKYHYDLAEDKCERLRRYSWHVLNPRQKFRTLSILAFARLAVGKVIEGARLLIDAKQEQPDDDKALANEARAYQLLGENGRAYELAAHARGRFPNSAIALTVWLNSSPMSCQLQELRAAVPAHLADDPEVLTA